MTAVCSKQLVKRYKDVMAVDGLDLSVPKGAVYGFLGPNGAGKTTTLKLLAGLIRPTSGSIEIFGEEVFFGSIRNRKDIGFLPDVPGFYEWMSAYEYLDFCGRLFSIPRHDLEKRIKDLLGLVGLSDTGKKKTGGFSRGMKQRLGIAQALINDPGIVLLDEPVSALDPIGRKEVMDIITELAGKVTVFFSTHVLADVERVCDRVIIINKGRAVLEDTIGNIKGMAPTRQIEIELFNKSTTSLVEDIRRCEWLDDMETADHKKIKLLVSDIERASLELPGLIYKANVSLKKFNVQEPTLEDIFIKAVNSNQ